MVKVKYRLVEERTPDDQWEVIGVIALWLDEPLHLQLRGLMQHTVSTSIWHEIQDRVYKNQLTLENYHEALKGYGQDYRLQPEIHTVEGKTADDIRHYLRQEYIYRTHESVLEAAD